MSKTLLSTAEIYEKYTANSNPAILVENAMDFDFFKENPILYNNHTKHIWEKESLKHSIYSTVLAEEFDERNKVRNLLDDFENMTLEQLGYDPKVTTPKMIEANKSNLLIRYLRINACIESKGEQLTTAHKSGYTYNTYKAYTYDESGRKVRSISRNDRDVMNEQNIIDKMSKLYKKLGYNVTLDYMFKTQNGTRFCADIVLEKDNKKTVLEVKSYEKEKYDKLFIFYTLWMQYLQTYYPSNKD